MSVEAAIVDKYTDPTDATTVPPRRFCVGQLPPVDDTSQEVVLPFISVERDGDSEVEYTTDSEYILQTMVFNVFSADKDEANLIADAIHTRYSREGWTTGGTNVLDFVRSDRQESQEDGSVWLISMDYLVTSRGF